MLGGGVFGTVYKGTLKYGREIAIKWLSRDIDLSTEVLMVESRVMARIKHTNLVKYFGFCIEGENKFLIQDFLPNEPLDRFLFDPSKRAQINWETWYKITLGIATGLEYLHEGTHPGIMHRRLNIHNVLVDEKMNPKIADFGISMIYKTSHRHVNRCRTAAVETYAYIAPEYCYTGNYSVKADVYSFGVLVLEIASDLRKSIRSMIIDEYRNQARKLWDEERLSELINPLIAKCPETELIIRCIQIGILCIQIEAEHRPTMTEVILMLTGKDTIPLPSTPST